MKVPKIFLPETGSDERLEKLLVQDEPRIGQYVYMYMPNASLFSYSRCKIAGIKEENRGGKKELFVEIKERPGWSFNWEYVQQSQKQWEEAYFDQMMAGQ